jgi:tetratricopeptide (TPR) repeat protein
MSRLAEAYLWSGRVNEALEYAQSAVELSTKHHERANEAIARRVLAEITALGASMDATDTVKHYADSLALAEKLGMRPLVAHCHLGLGKLYRRIAAHQAAEHLKTALGMYREMDMRSWLERVEAEIRKL